MAHSDSADNDAGPARFQASADVVAQRLGDEVVLVHVKTDRIFVLNRTGARLWELLCTGLDRVDIQQRMLQEFDVSEAQLAGEVEALFTSLKDEQLIVPA